MKATIPDGIPFNIDDLELEDEPMEMQVGGFVQPTFTPGGMQQSQFTNTNSLRPIKCQTTRSLLCLHILHLNKLPHQMAPTAVPQFSSFVTPTYVTYVNDAGNTIQIPVGPDGKPLIPVPAGFKKQTDTPTCA